MAASALLKPIFTFFLFISFLTLQSHAADEDCEPESGSCVDKSAALPLKLIAIASILVTSMIGVCLPLLSRAFPTLHPDKELFTLVKAFAAGIILATGFMHVLPDSFDMLSSNCLSDNPWHKFPFTGFVAMLSAIATLMVDSLATSTYTKKNSAGVKPENVRDAEMATVNAPPLGHFHGHSHRTPMDMSGAQLLRYRVVAMVRFSSFFQNCNP